MGTTFTGKKIKATYKDVVQFGNAGIGIADQLNTLCDGDGLPSALWLSTDVVALAQPAAGMAAKLETIGADASIPLHLAPKGPSGYIQAGPDTYGMSNWNGQSLGIEYLNLASTTQGQAIYIETYAANTVYNMVGVVCFTGCNMPAGQTVTYSQAGNFQIYATGGGRITHGLGVYTQVLADGGSSIDEAICFQAWQYNTTSVVGTNKGYGFYLGHSVTTALAENYGIWVQDLTGTATNGYFLWYDSPGVYLVRADGSQAFHNPSFTKYTPGTVNFERLAVRWASNTATLTTEAGGTGVQRPLKIN